MTWRILARMCNAARLEPVSRSVRSCLFPMTMSDFDSVSIVDRAAGHGAKNQGVWTLRRQLLDLPPYRNLNACTSSAMSLFRTVKHAVLYSISSVLAIVKIMEKFSKKSCSERTRPGRLLRVRLYWIIFREYREPPVGTFISERQRPLQTHEARKSTLERSCTDG